MIRLPLIVLAFVFVGTVAQAQPTMEQRSACEQDAYKFCQEQIPDERRVRNCLVKNMRRLNSVCRSAFQRGKKGR